LKLTLYDVTSTLHLLISARVRRLPCRTEPRRGARPRLTLVHAELSLTVLGVAQDAQTTTRGAGRKRPVDAGEAVLRMRGTDRLQSASSRPHMGRSPTSFRLLPSVSGGLLSNSADSGVRGNLGRAGGQRVAAARG
jgi:hypothetical protein